MSTKQEIAGNWLKISRIVIFVSKDAKMSVSLLLNVLLLIVYNFTISFRKE